MLLKLYTRVNTLSLDVAAGAVCSALFFAKLFDVVILPYGLLSLAMSVWVIYTIDHLLDARKIKGTASTVRHRFHQRNFKALFIAVIAVSLTAMVVVMFVRTAVLKGGLILIGTCMAYLVIHRWVKFPKEVLIAVLYTAGVLLPSVSVTTLPVHEWPIILIVQFLVTAFLNLTLFSWFDRERDRLDGNMSIVSLIEEKATSRVIWLMVATNILLCLWSNHLAASLLIGVMNLTLLFIFLNGERFVDNEKFRLLGDAVFYFPVLYLFLS